MDKVLKRKKDDSMYDSRYIELEKLMNIINKLNKELQLVKKDINNKESKSKELVSYIEQKIKENTKSIKELENPFLLFIMGSGNYGKSTLINALLQHSFFITILLLSIISGDGSSSAVISLAAISICSATVQSSTFIVYI